MFLSQTNGTILHYYNEDEEKSIEHLAKAGFKYVDISFFTRFIKGSKYFSDDYLQIVDTYKEALKKYDMTPVQAHEPAGNSIGDDDGEYYMKKTPRSIEMAAKIGCPSITIHPGSKNHGHSTREEFVLGNVRAIKRLIPYAEEYNIEILLENIGYANTQEFSNLYSVTANDLIAIIDEINHPLIKANWDVGHAHFNGLDEYKELKTLGNRLHGIHVHDNFGFMDILDTNGRKVSGDMHTLPLFCSLDFDAVIKALLEIGYKGTFNFEVDNPMKPLKYTDNREDLLPYAQKVRLQSDILLYETGKLLLKKYNCLDE